ncbi:MAG TPA: glycosyltransferase family 2 protein [Candidatus Limnocylindria bacterium]|nr:glycosyltransferase family 2 protein [Candidatus Limnocylindria bacterium]
MKLLIVIPALNEEQSIESIIRRSLEARAHIIEDSPVTAVDITVVSDGSTDRTVERARRHADSIKLIVFEKNRGYGAAIKEAWRQSDADLLGFLDADGTCDPNFFADLCRTLVSEQADVVLGSRLNQASKMPLVRRVGNRGFATLLRALSSSRVRDTASGMRVVRRESLGRLLPLPDGLSFTPAMTARAVLGTAVKIVEIDMPYHEREGESKLRLGRETVLFLRVILEAAFLYRPSRPLALIGLVALAVASAWMMRPILYYLEHLRVQEWMIYRFLVSHVLGTIAALLLCASYLTAKIVKIARPATEVRSRLLTSRLFWLVPAVCFFVGGVLVLASFLELLRTGETYEHWSRFVAMSFFWSIGSVFAVTRVMDYVLDLLAAQLAYERQTARRRRDDPPAV